MGGVVVGGDREAAEAWVARVEDGGNIAWELSLPDPGQVRAIAVAADDAHVLQRDTPTGTRLHTVDSSGELVSTTVLPLVGEVPPLAEAILVDEQRLLLGGSVAGDMWLASLGTNGEVSTLVVEDHLGFSDSVDHLLALPTGYLAVASVGTTPGTLDGDILVAEAVDMLLVYFDDQHGERRRVTLSDEDQYVSTVATSVALASDGSVVLVGYRQPTLEAGERSAWATRLVDGEQAWFAEWRGPGDSSSAHPLASLHAVAKLGDATVVAGGRMHTADGIRRWHLLLDLATGEVIVEQLGDGNADFDSYLAGSEDTPRFTATTSTTTRSEQSVCTFEIVG